jgi:hypothetical protein
MRGVVALACAFACVLILPAGRASAAEAVAGVAAADGDRYWTVTTTGTVTPGEHTPSHGDLRGVRLNAPIAGMFATASGNGYWLLGADGGIFSFGDARFYGSTGSLRLNRPIVGMAPTPTGRGYWLVASDGGIFSFGDAQFYGSTGSLRLNRPIVGIAPSATGRGYWLVGADGGIFSFGDAQFAGSTGGLRLNEPMVGMVASDGGYLMVARDGGVFAFGAAEFVGSMGGERGFKAAGIAPVKRGYVVVGSDGATYLLRRGERRQVTPPLPSSPPSTPPTSPPPSTPGAGPAGWPTLAWQDTFDGAGLDRTRWYPNRWFADTCSFGANPNTEVQSYWADNVVQPGDGTLRLVAKREARPCAENSWSGTKPFTSGWVQTGGANADADVAPGVTCAGDCYWEVTFKMSPGAQLFPAVWLMPVNGSSYPSRPEIDAVEFTKSWTAWTHNIHFDCADARRSPDYQGAAITDGQWHRIGISVEPGNRITWYVDGVQTWAYTGCGIPSAAQQMYLIVNVAVAGQAPYPPDGEPFPKEMVVDRVALYRR